MSSVEMPEVSFPLFNAAHDCESENVGEPPDACPVEDAMDESTCCDASAPHC